jgi:uncharacterized protein
MADPRAALSPERGRGQVRPESAPALSAGGLGEGAGSWLADAPCAPAASIPPAPWPSSPAKIRSADSGARSPSPPLGGEGGSRPFAVLLLAAIRLYKLTLSPALASVGVRCRHWPSCSSYTAAAVRRHGAWAGSWMGLARLLRCHPFGTHGIDPPPATLSSAARWWTPWRYGDWRGPRGVERETSCCDRNTNGEERCEHAEAHVP